MGTGTSSRAGGRGPVSSSSEGKRTCPHFSYGFTATEVLISVALLAFTMIPMSTLFTSGSRQSSLNEFHVLAQARASTVIETLLTQEFQVFEPMGIGTPTPMDPSLFVPGLGEPPESLTGRLEAFEEELTYEGLEDGLGRLKMVITWELPGAVGRKARHRYVLTRLVARPEHSLRLNYEPRQK